MYPERGMVDPKQPSTQPAPSGPKPDAARPARMTKAMVRAKLRAAVSQDPTLGAVDPSSPTEMPEWEESDRPALQRALAFIHDCAVEPPEVSAAADEPPPPARESRGEDWRDSSPATTRALVRAVRDLLDDRLTVTEIERQVLRVARGEVPPPIEDDELRGAYRRASEVIDRVLSLQDELVAEGVDEDRRAAAISKIDLVHLAVNGETQVSPERFNSLARADIINSFEYVARLRLPEVLAALYATDEPEGLRARWFLRSLFSDVGAVRSFIAFRWPDLAAGLRDEQARRVLQSIRSGGNGGSKWHEFAALFELMGLYEPKKKGSGNAAPTIERQYRDACRKRGALAFDREHRMSIWARLVRFLAAAGFGSFTAADADRTWRNLPDR